jgi:multidrug resistance efflux pump
MPLLPSFQGKISEMAQEGSLVSPGDFLLRIDGSSIDSQIDAQIEQLEVFKSTADKDNINLKIDLNNAQIAFERAKIRLEIAKVKSEVPLEYIGELAYKQNQLQYKNSEKTFEKSKNDLNEVHKKIINKQHEINLGLTQRQNKLDYLKETLSRFSINASQEGFIIYSNSWRGEKIQVGDQLNSGMQVLSVSQNTDLQIIAWVNAIDIPKLKSNQDVNIQFDSFLGSSYKGEIINISSGGEDKQVWGDSLYYKCIVKISDQPPAQLMLGMSALIEVVLEENTHHE